MSSQFPRSATLIQSRNLRPALIGIIIFIFLVILWGGWFLFAQVSFYETSQSAILSSEGIIVADFPQDALTHIQQGQTALFKVIDSTGQPQQISATVAIVDRSQNQIKLIPTVDDATVLGALTHGMPGQVDVIIEQLSPATLILKSAGLRSISN